MSAYLSKSLRAALAAHDGRPVTTHLQSVGDVPAVPVSELEVGDLLMWNFGTTSTVVAIEEASPKFLAVTEEYEEETVRRYGGESRYVRRMKKDRLVAALVVRDGKKVWKANLKKEDV